MTWMFWFVMGGLGGVGSVQALGKRGSFLMLPNIYMGQW